MAKTKAVKKTADETPKKGRKPVPENETKEQKLARLADHRVTAACNRIRLVGNLAAYKPTSEDIKNIMTALAEACANVNNRLEGVRSESIVFRLHQ